MSKGYNASMLQTRTCMAKESFSDFKSNPFPFLDTDKIEETNKKILMDLEAQAIVKHVKSF